MRTILHVVALQALASGIDERPVVAAREGKSMSAEETFGSDIRDPGELLARLTVLADRAAVLATARRLLSEWLAGRPNAALRLLGVGVADLQIPRQIDLFGQSSKGARLDATIDGIRDRFGSAMLTRASLLERAGARPAASRG